jgi:Xaa-Pro aminopeptidase
MRRPVYDMSIFRERRQKLAAKYPGAAFIIPAHPEHSRNGSVDHPYRQDTNLFYLTGFEEPSSVLVFRPGQNPETVLFTLSKDESRETWNGFRYGPEAAESEFKVDKAYPIEEFDRVVVELLKPVQRLYYRWNNDLVFDRKMMEVLEADRQTHYRTGRGNLPVHDAKEAIGELRLFKSENDVATMRKACDISAKAHIEAMRFTKPGVNERQLKGVLLQSFLMQGAEREGYNTIVASGANATTLHYVYNDQECKDGDLLLIDAGAEYQFYTGDITRTFPVSGKFTAAQKRVYEPLLEIQKEVIKRVKPGIAFRSMQDMTVELLTDLMLELKLLEGSRQKNIDTLAFKKYYMHGVSHWLGMDVHDTGLQILNGQPRLLEPGMAFTVEPGLYIPMHDLNAPEDLRGIGIRIEDNIVVTVNGHENLTEGAPKEIKDLEAIIGAR